MALTSALLSGCDPLAAPAYQGESRLQLSMRVENGASPNNEALVPALARASDTEVRFQLIEVHGEFPAGFQGEVYAAPSAALLAPLDAWFAPDTRMVTEYLSAVPKRRIAEPIDLTPDTVLFPDCWDGSCDFVPGTGREVPECAADDRECRRSAGCTRDGADGECVLELDTGTLPSALRDLYGFAQGFMVVYTEHALPGDSWAAQRLAAADGLSAGYHLAQLIEPTAEAHGAAAECEDAARAEAITQYEAAHATSLHPLALPCVLNPIAECAQIEVPSGSDALELTTGIARAEVEHGCLALAPDMKLIDDPLREQITVRIGDALPAWRPVAIHLSPDGEP